MRFSEEIDLREGLVYDPRVKEFDSSFWKGDTANLLFDASRQAIKIGDTGLVGSVSSYSQYLYGDFEFSMRFDSLSPDSNDSEKFFGLRNLGDSDNKGSAFFDLSYDSENDTIHTRTDGGVGHFRAVVHGEDTTRVRINIQWDTLWGGGGLTTRFRITWEENGYTFLVNDTVVATIGPGRGNSDSLNDELVINTSIPQAVRLSNRSLDTTDTNPTQMALLNIRHARKII